MPRYVTRARKSRSYQDEYWFDESPLMPDLTVVETEPAPTGLFDAHGNEIWRMNDPIGFRFGGAKP